MAAQGENDLFVCKAEGPSLGLMKTIWTNMDRCMKTRRLDSQLDYGWKCAFVSIPGKSLSYTGSVFWRQKTCASVAFERTANAKRNTLLVRY
jgi:hypothetical protein